MAHCQKKANLNMTYLTSLQLVCLPLVIVGGLFGMNVKVPFQEFLRDEGEFVKGVSEKYTDFSYEWWLNSLVPLLPFYCIVILASTCSVLFYFFFKKQQWL